MIAYVKGDATYPQGSGSIFIPHVVSTAKCWGAGFVLALSRRWKEPERSYRSWYLHGDLQPFALGEVQFVLVPSGKPDPLQEVGCFTDTDKSTSIVVCNMIAQKGVGRGADGSIPLRYDALEKCLTRVAKVAKLASASAPVSIAAPRFGAGLASGDWTKIEAIIERTCEGISVSIYDLP